MSNNSSKAKYWQAIAYNENLLDGWQDVIAEKFQVPFVYCIHDKDKDKSGNARKIHTHIIIAFKNTTTENTALSVFKTIEKQGFSAFPNDRIEMVRDIGNAYMYLIHDTEDSRKKGKYQYPKNERVCGNNFDIGCYEQISQADKVKMIDELACEIYKNNFSNFLDFDMYVRTNYGMEYKALIISYSGYFERLTKGCYQRKIAESMHNVPGNEKTT